MPGAQATGGCREQNQHVAKIVAAISIHESKRKTGLPKRKFKENFYFFKTARVATTAATALLPLFKIGRDSFCLNSFRPKR